jgi:hypothetical protein
MTFYKRTCGSRTFPILAMTFKTYRRTISRTFRIFGRTFIYRRTFCRTCGFRIFGRTFIYRRTICGRIFWIFGSTFIYRRTICRAFDSMTDL